LNLGAPKGLVFKTSAIPLCDGGMFISEKDSF
jgi:hypothetical protein